MMDLIIYTVVTISLVSLYFILGIGAGRAVGKMNSEPLGMAHVLLWPYALVLIAFYGECG